MERAIEFPHTNMDRRPRKRQRLGWDVVPQAPKVSDLFTHALNTLICMYFLLFLPDLIKVFIFILSIVELLF